MLMQQEIEDYFNQFEPSQSIPRLTTAGRPGTDAVVIPRARTFIRLVEQSSLYGAGTSMNYAQSSPAFLLPSRYQRLPFQSIEDEQELLQAVVLCVEYPILAQPKLHIPSAGPTPFPDARSPFPNQRSSLVANVNAALRGSITRERRDSSVSISSGTDVVPFLSDLGLKTLLQQVFQLSEGDLQKYQHPLRALLYSPRVHEQVVAELLRAQRRLTDAGRFPGHDLASFPPARGPQPARFPLFQQDTRDWLDTVELQLSIKHIDAPPRLGISSPAAAPIHSLAGASSNALTSSGSAAAPSGSGPLAVPPAATARAVRTGAGGSAESDIGYGSGFGSASSRISSNTRRVQFVNAVNQIARPFYTAAVASAAGAFPQKQGALQLPAPFTVSYRELFERMRALYTHLVRSVVRFELHGGFALGRTEGRELLSDVAKCVLREFERRFGVLANAAQITYLAALVEATNWDPRNALYLRHLTRCLSRIGRALGIALPAAAGAGAGTLKASSSSFDEARATGRFSSAGGGGPVEIARQLAAGARSNSASEMPLAMASSLPRVLSGVLADDVAVDVRSSSSKQDTRDASIGVLKKQLSPSSKSAAARLGGGGGIGSRRSSTPPSVAPPVPGAGAVAMSPAPAQSGAASRRSSSVLSRARLSPTLSAGGALTTRNWLELRPLNGAILTVQETSELGALLRALVEHCEKCLTRFTKLYADASQPPTASATPARVHTPSAAATASAAPSPPSLAALELLLRLYELSLCLARAFERDYLRPLNPTPAPTPSPLLSPPPFPAVPTSSGPYVTPTGLSVPPAAATNSSSSSSSTTIKSSSQTQTLATRGFAQSSSSSSFGGPLSPLPFALLVKNSVLVCISEEYAQLQNDWHCQLQSRAALTGDELQRERDDRAVRDAAAESLSRSRSRWTLRGSKSKRAAPPAPAAPSSGTLGLRGRLNLSPTLVYKVIEEVRDVVVKLDATFGQSFAPLFPLARVCALQFYERVLTDMEALVGEQCAQLELSGAQSVAQLDPLMVGLVYRFKQLELHEWAAHLNLKPMPADLEASSAATLLSSTQTLLAGESMSSLVLAESPSALMARRRALQTRLEMLLRHWFAAAQTRATLFLGQLLQPNNPRAFEACDLGSVVSVQPQWSSAPGPSSVPAGTGRGVDAVDSAVSSGATRTTTSASRDRASMPMAPNPIPIAAAGPTSSRSQNSAVGYSPNAQQPQPLIGSFRDKRSAFASTGSSYSSSKWQSSPRQSSAAQPMLERSEQTSPLVSTTPTAAPPFRSPPDPLAPVIVAPRPNLDPDPESEDSVDRVSLQPPENIQPIPEEPVQTPVGEEVDADDEEDEEELGGLEEYAGGPRPVSELGEEVAAAFCDGGGAEDRSTSLAAFDADPLTREHAVSGLRAGAVPRVPGDRSSTSSRLMAQHSDSETTSAASTPLPPNLSAASTPLPPPLIGTLIGSDQVSLTPSVAVIDPVSLTSMPSTASQPQVPATSTHDFTDDEPSATRPKPTQSTQPPPTLRPLTSSGGPAAEPVAPEPEAERSTATAIAEVNARELQQRPASASQSSAGSFEPLAHLRRLPCSISLHDLLLLVVRLERFALSIGEFHCAMPGLLRGTTGPPPTPAPSPVPPTSATRAPASSSPKSAIPAAPSLVHSTNKGVVTAASTSDPLLAAAASESSPEAALVEGTSVTSTPYSTLLRSKPSLDVRNGSEHTPTSRSSGYSTDRDAANSSARTLSHAAAPESAGTDSSSSASHYLKQPILEVVVDPNDSGHQSIEQQPHKHLPLQVRVRHQQLQEPETPRTLDVCEIRLRARRSAYANLVARYAVALFWLDSYDAPLDLLLEFVPSDLLERVVEFARAARDYMSSLVPLPYSETRARPPHQQFQQSQQRRPMAVPTTLSVWRLEDMLTTDARHLNPLLAFASREPFLEPRLITRINSLLTLSRVLRSCADFAELLRVPNTQSMSLASARAPLLQLTSFSYGPEAGDSPIATAERLAQIQIGRMLFAKSGPTNPRGPADAPNSSFLCQQSIQPDAQQSQRGHRCCCGPECMFCAADAHLRAHYANVVEGLARGSEKLLAERMHQCFVFTLRLALDEMLESLRFYLAASLDWLQQFVEPESGLRLNETPAPPPPAAQMNAAQTGNGCLLCAEKVRTLRQMAIARVFVRAALDRLRPIDFARSLRQMLSMAAQLPEDSFARVQLHVVKLLSFSLYALFRNALESAFLNRSLKRLLLAGCNFELSFALLMQNLVRRVAHAFAEYRPAGQAPIVEQLRRLFSVIELQLVVHTLPTAQLVALFYRVSKQELLWSYGVPGPVPVASPTPTAGASAPFFNEPFAFIGCGVDENVLLPGRYRRDLFRCFLNMTELEVQPSAPSSAVAVSSCSDDLLRVTRFFEFLFHLWLRTRTKTQSQLQSGAFTIQRLQYLVRSLVSRRFLNGSVPSAQLVEDFLYNQLNDPLLKLLRPVATGTTAGEAAFSEPPSGGSDLESATSREQTPAQLQVSTTSPFSDVPIVAASASQLLFGVSDFRPVSEVGAAFGRSSIGSPTLGLGPGLNAAGIGMGPSSPTTGAIAGARASRADSVGEQLLHRTAGAAADSLDAGGGLSSAAADGTISPGLPQFTFDWMHLAETVSVLQYERVAPLILSRVLNEEYATKEAPDPRVTHMCQFDLPLYAHFERDLFADRLLRHLLRSCVRMCRSREEATELRHMRSADDESDPMAMAAQSSGTSTAGAANAAGGQKPRTMTQTSDTSQASLSSSYAFPSLRNKRFGGSSVSLPPNPLTAAAATAAKSRLAANSGDGRRVTNQIPLPRPANVCGTQHVLDARVQAEHVERYYRFMQLHAATCAESDEVRVGLTAASLLQVVRLRTAISSYLPAYVRSQAVSFFSSAASTRASIEWLTDPLAELVASYLRTPVLSSVAVSSGEDPLNTGLLLDLSSSPAPGSALEDDVDSLLDIPLHRYVFNPPNGFSLRSPRRQSIDPNGEDRSPVQQSPDVRVRRGVPVYTEEVGAGCGCCGCINRFFGSDSGVPNESRRPLSPARPLPPRY